MAITPGSSAVPRTCTVCTHPERAAIDQALVAGEATRKIMARYGTFSHTSLQRHQAHHLPDALVKARDADDVGHALDIGKQLRAINAVSLNILDEARRSNNPAIALKAIDRVQRQIELQAKLLGELDDRPHVDIVLTPEWLTARATLLAALAPYPEARGRG
jgi:hypothetical protein